MNLFTDNLILGSHNFLLFIILFTFSLGFGVITWLSYKRTPLVYINVGMFVFCALRACTEFGMHLTDSPIIIHQINTYNSIIAHMLFVLSWFLLYFHILPFKKSKYSKTINWIVSVFIITLPNLIIVYHFLTFQYFEFSSVKIDGYWMFRPKNSSAQTFYQVYLFIFMAWIFTSALMIYSIIEKQNDRIKKILLLLFFYTISFISAAGYTSYSVDGWRVTNHAIPMLIDAIIMTWFVSGYKLVHDQFKAASSDILNSISELIIQTDANLNVMNMNLAATQNFEPQIKNLREYVDSKSLNSKSDELDRLVESNFENIELTLLINDRNKHFKTKANPYIWRGKELGYSFVFTDITELKTKEVELSRSNQTKDQLFSILAHDLRKPALAFRGITKKINYLLQKRDFVSLDRLGESIEQSALSLNALIDNLLNWALSQKDMISINRHDVNVDQLLNETLTMLHMTIRDKGIQIESQNVDPNLTLYTDPDILLTILRNLLDNAIKYSHVDGQISISTSSDLTSNSIVIQDYGIGMSPQKVDSYKLIYQNKSQKGTAGEKGSGIGLNLVSELVKKTHGQIKIESELSHGTTISLIYKKNTAQF